MPEKQLFLATKVAEDNSEKDDKVSSESNKLNVQIGCPIINEEYTSNSNINAEEAKSHLKNKLIIQNIIILQEIHR